MRNELALAFIVRNESKYALLMLESILPVVGYVSILDSGSTDNTPRDIEIFLERQNVNYSLKRIALERFDEMRNAAIDGVPSRFSWVLMLDADEVIPSDKLSLMHALLEQEEVDAWRLPRFNFVEIDGQSFVAYPDYQARLFRHGDVKGKIRYEGAVHEHLVGYKKMRDVTCQAKPEPSTAGLHIHHMKWLWKSHIELHERETQYQSILNSCRKGAM